tara:strand:+ start:5540 stop:6043 length:504 start_codon:yes stop_codon:yes gene_type:complete
MEIGKHARVSLALIFGSLVALPAQAAVQPGNECSSTPAQIAANKQLVETFYDSSGADKVALIHPDYIQHDPAFEKRSEINGTSAYDEIASAILNGSQPTPESANREIVIVMAECDFVTGIVKRIRPDPHTAGRTYELYTFDVFRVLDGKLYEHWDGVDLNRAPGAPE